MIGICIGLEIKESVLPHVRHLIPAHITIPKGNIPTKLTTIKNKLWDEPLVIVGSCQLNNETCECFVENERNFAVIKEACKQQLKALKQEVEMQEEELLEVNLWIGTFLSVEAAH